MNMQFEPGVRYRNRLFEYEVLRTEGQRLVVRTSEGDIRILDVSIQGRILQNLDLEARLEAARQAGRTYESHCWRCTAFISGAELRPCNVCRWYVCRHCQACGCGYPRRWAFARVDFAI